ncbi:zinc finger and SCAN domain-containing protein 2-like isoform X1 [Anarrhichthys ocellatus]|uniref:zinc finger and SCAN domain-containing protein 2-like isoform X1 n=1 Tax=Anarrhichthys ocellatus TaxID=433405 RepID=UPI0012ED4699|nr:zinc finger and SCAN domain-containing protein 2-like isoform X1 [Anarrhichthys ocellatus]
MSKVEMLRVVVTERLTAAAEEIFGLFERTLAEYEEELCRSKRDNECQRKLLDAVLKPEVRLHRVVLSADVQQDPEPPHIKEQQEQCWSSQEEEQLQGPFPVKSEDDEAQSSQLHQMQEENSEAEPPASSSAQQGDMESDREDHGGSEPTRSLDPDSYSQPANDETLESSEQVDTVKSKRTQTGVSVSQPARDDRTSDSCEPETEDSDGHWEETKKLQSNLKTLTNNGVAEGEDHNTSKKSLSCSKCGKTFKPNGKSAPGMEPSACSVCVQRSTQSSRLITNKRTHSGENIFRCSVCKRQFSYKGDAVRHIRIHTGEKPFSCSVCSKRFTQSTGLSSHMRTHTGEKPFSCSLCPKRFIRSGVLDRHMRVHTGEKPYSCSECNASFSLSQSLLKHMRIHTGEKPFSCSVCDKNFTQKGHLTQHMMLHTGEKSFSCRVCGRKFTRQSRVKNHKCLSESSSSK